MEPKVLTTSAEYEKELTRIFNRFNKHFWGNELPNVIITFVPTRRAHGHMTTEPVWVSKKTGECKYELNISALTIDRTPEEICATLLHEQCHLYARVRNIKETSDNHRYHNSEFKRIAQDHGLDVKHDDRIGWSITSLDDAAKRYVKKINVKQFDLSRLSKATRSVPLMRYECPSCKETVAWLSKYHNLICGNCGVSLVYSPSKK